MHTTDVIEQLSKALRTRVELVGDPDGRTLRAVPDTASDDYGIDVPVGIGSLALRIPGRSRSDLEPRMWGLVDAAALLMGRELGGEAAGHRDGVYARLLDAVETVRGDALWEVRSRRWLAAPGEPLRVWAVLLEEASPLEHVAIGRHLAAVVPLRAEFVAVRDGAVILVSPADDTLPTLSAEMEAEARSRGVEVLAVATADGGADIDDLGETATRAIDAARLRAALPQPLAARAEELGGWMLVQSLPRSASLLRLACPAAHDLLVDGDAVQRETVEAYLDAAGRAPVACARLHIHRTTLYYRLEHLPETVRAALADGLQRSTLHLALKTIRLWERSPSDSSSPAEPSADGERLRA